ncbi:MAG: bleomycin resistance protein [Caulobacter sp.]|nr:bleomycin resistance protein [Caulobacter sp.]
MKAIVPILFVRDVPIAAAFYRDKLGFEIDFLYGEPPFYGAVRRGGARLHLRHVRDPNFAELAAREASLILATVEVEDIQALYAEFEAKGVVFPQTVTRQVWGGTEFHVRDPDGNVISFVEY